METIESLRKKGVKVRVSHYRRPVLTIGSATVKPDIFLLESEIRRLGLNFNPSGGYTELLITEDGIDYTLRSRCKNTDSYNKKIGVQLALDKINL
jgi:hypothetical protein